MGSNVPLTGARFRAKALNKEIAMATTVDARRETASLIGSEKVEGTAVYGADDRKIGSVQRVMLDKISGKVAYAVISFGGFLGMGEDYYELGKEAVVALHNEGDFFGEGCLSGQSQCSGRHPLWQEMYRRRTRAASSSSRSPSRHHPPLGTTPQVGLPSHATLCWSNARARLPLDAYGCARPSGPSR
jgi:hypothetical protein